MGGRAGDARHAEPVEHEPVEGSIRCDVGVVSTQREKPALVESGGETRLQGNSRRYP
jgi:hypothetical protein